MKQHKFGIKKREYGICVSMGPTRKCRTNHCHQLHRTNHENFVKLRRTIGNKTGLQSDPAGQVINLSKKRFTKETFKLLNKSLNFVQLKQISIKPRLTKNWKIFTTYKLKAHLKNPENKARFTEEDIQKINKQNLGSK